MKYYSYKQMYFLFMRRLQDRGFGIASQSFELEVVISTSSGVYRYDNVDHAFAFIHNLEMEGTKFKISVVFKNEVELFNQLLFDYE